MWSLSRGGQLRGVVTLRGSTIYVLTVFTRYTVIHGKIICALKSKE